MVVDMLGSIRIWCNSMLTSGFQLESNRGLLSSTKIFSECSQPSNAQGAECGSTKTEGARLSYAESAGYNSAGSA
jgi:hypothetical protein